MKHANALIRLTLLGFLLDSVDSTKIYSDLVYKKCSREIFHDSQSLNSLFSDLVSQSLQTKFYKTASENTNGVSGFFQCKEDLTNNDCSICVTRLLDMSTKHCTKAVAAKIHLSGCLLKYGTDTPIELNRRMLGFREKYDEEHKICSSERVEEEGFEEKRDAMFEEVELRAAARGGDDRSREVEYDGFRVEAVCEEDMEVCACAECISHAVEIAKEECQWSVSGRVFLTRCSLSYLYEEYRGGEGTGGGEGGGYGGEGGGYGGEGGGYGRGEGYDGDGVGNEFGGERTGRTIAIIIGGAAAVLVIALLFLFICRVGKKDDC